MAKFGEGYCWTIKNDPSVCPYIKPGEEHLLGDVKRRVKEKCIECNELKNDLRVLAEEAEERVSFFETFPVILDELLKREQKLKKSGKSIEIKEEMFDMLVHLSTSLKLVLDVDEILYKGLVAFTAGSSFGFNRAVVLLSENRKLYGHFVLGPRSPEEAFAIWRDISERNPSIADLFNFSPYLFQKEKEKFSGVLRKMQFDINEGVFRKAFKTEMILKVSPEHYEGVDFNPPGTVLRVSPEDGIPDALRDFYGDTPFWVIPLFSHLKRPLGVILLDNFLTKREISQEEAKAVKIFSSEISLALERGFTYEELEEKVETLEEANVKLKKHQELIMKLREEASIGEMVLQLTHSFKNPIIAIAGLARVLKKKTPADTAVTKYTDAILEEAFKLEKTLKDFINFTKTKYTSNKDSVDINRVVELLYEEKKTQGKLQGISFNINLEEKLPPVLGNDYQLYNSVENVVNNSIEAMSEGGELFIETEAQGGHVLIRIRDTGPGMSEEVMKNLFQPFFTTKAMGSGLGLYTSKEIIEKTGGSITVSCERERGCCVSIVLPVLSEEVKDEKYLNVG